MGPIVIIGNGIAGITTARQVRKRSTAPIIVISSETEHFFSRTALMYIFMGHMKYEHTKPYEDWFWEKNKIQLIYDHVEQVNFKGKSLQLRSGKTVSYEKLVLATGSKPNKFGWPGQDLKGVQSLYSYQDLELLEENVSKGVRKAVIVGGGLIGIEIELFWQSSINLKYASTLKKNCVIAEFAPALTLFLKLEKSSNAFSASG